MYPATTIKKTRKKSKVDLYEDIVPRTVLVSIKTLLDQRRQSNDVAVEPTADRVDMKERHRHRNAETGEMSFRVQSSTEVTDKTADLLLHSKTSEKLQGTADAPTNVLENTSDADKAGGRTAQEGQTKKDPIYAKVNKKKGKDGNRSDGSIGSAFVANATI